MKRIAVALIIVAAVGGALGAAAQTPEAGTLLTQAEEAYRAEAYERAVDILERAIEADASNAEAYYLLARVYTETPLRDGRKASRYLDRALELQPQDVQLLVARLLQLRTESWNFFSERLKEARRLELSRDILELDPDNPFAHEELGTVHIRDFWRYRNAIMMPALQGGFGLPYERGDYGPTESFAVAEGLQESSGSPFEQPGLLSDPGSVFLADQFDIETLQQMGVPVQDLSARADRAYRRAIGHLEASLEADPRRRPVYDHMMEIYALKGEFEAALEMLEEMYVFFPEDPQLWTYLGLSHHRLGHADAAAKSFETAFRFMTPEERDAYDRLDELLGPDERAAYEAEPVAYASQFWTSKDPRYLTPYNERKLEHYARLTYADLLFGAPGVGLRGWDTQRGHILVRYGLPRLDVTIVPDVASAGVRRVVAQSIQNRDAVAQSGAIDTENPSAAPTPSPPAGNLDALAELNSANERMFDLLNTINIWDYGDFKFVFEDPFRNGEYRLFSPSAEAIGQGVNPYLNDYEIIARETFRKVPERYTYEAPGRQIELPYLVNAFKGADGETELFVHYGVPITTLPEGQDAIELTANTGTFLISDQRDILVERRRTIYGLPIEQVVPFAETNLWVDTQQIEAPPGRHELSVEFETATGGTVAVQRRSVEVPDFTGEALALSDLMLAYDVRESDIGALRQGDLVRSGLSITPAPWSVFPSERPIYLYFELYNLAQDASGETSYDVEILLVPQQETRGVRRVFERLFGGEKGVSIAFTGSGSRAEEGLYQLFDPQDSAPGLYTLILRVQDTVAGRTVEQETDLFVE